LIPPEIMLYFRWIVAGLACFVVFYTVLSFAIKDRNWVAVLLAACLSFFTYEKMAEALNHLSLYMVWGFLGLFVSVVIYNGVKNKFGKK